MRSGLQQALASLNRTYAPAGFAERRRFQKK